MATWWQWGTRGAFLLAALGVAGSFATLFGALDDPPAWATPVAFALSLALAPAVWMARRASWSPALSDHPTQAWLRGGEALGAPMQGFRRLNPPEPSRRESFHVRVRVPDGTDPALLEREARRALKDTTTRATGRSRARLRARVTDAPGPDSVVSVRLDVDAAGGHEAVRDAFEETLVDRLRRCGVSARRA